MEQDNDKLQQSIVSIASELFRFQRVFDKAISKIEINEREKYISQFSWFKRKVLKAIEEANFKVLNPEGQLYDPGMALTPINIDDFEVDDQLYVLKTIEPIIMKDDKVFKTGTVLLGRVKR